nr:hypothetical protein JVH1_6571 [Rhodococcus sp. JVH1]
MGGVADEDDAFIVPDGDFGQRVHERRTVQLRGRPDDLERLRLEPVQLGESVEPPVVADICRFRWPGIGNLRGPPHGSVRSRDVEKGAAAREDHVERAGLGRDAVGELRADTVARGLGAYQSTARDDPYTGLRCALPRHLDQGTAHQRRAERRTPPTAVRAELPRAACPYWTTFAEWAPRNRPAAPGPGNRAPPAPAVRWMPDSEMSPPVLPDRSVFRRG